ncbi:MAG TPA: hypothetical protein VF076_08925 [Acidimicrobiales bacterium]
MTDAVTTPPPHPAKDDDNLILDELSERLATLRILREDDPDARGRMLEEIGVRGKAEEDIVSQMADRKPLWRPDRFEEAHRLAMRSLEVLDRNGVRKVTVPRLGPLTPAAEWSTQQVTRFVVKNHQNTVIDRIRKLYERREANCDWESQDRRLLRRARYDAARVEPGYKGKTIGVPAFLLGGAALSGAFSAVQRTLRSALDNKLLTVVFGIVVVAVFVGAAWSAVYGAAIARRRIRLALDQPLKALYETIGACGRPPQDQSTNFAIYAIGLFLLAWIVIPAIIYQLIK